MKQLPYPTFGTMHARLIASLWLVILAALSVSAAQAQLVQNSSTALDQDAAEYARQYSVSLDDGVRRLRAQSDSVPAIDTIALRYRDRLAGISIQHRPDYRFIVYLTGDQSVAPTSIRAGGMIVPVTFRTGARATRDRVVWAITYHQAAIRAMFASPPSMGLDPRTGELVVIGASAVAGHGGPAVLRSSWKP